MMLPSLSSKTSGILALMISAIASLQSAYKDYIAAQKKLDGAAMDKARARLEAAISALTAAQNR